MSKYMWTLLICGILIALPLISGTSFTSLLLAPVIVLFLAARTLYGLSKRATPVRETVTKLSILAATVALLFGIHSVQAASALREATAVLAKVLEHKSQRGAYPKKLEEVGLDDMQLRQNQKLFYFGQVANGGPLLFYHSRANPFDKFHYDFGSRTWRLRED